MLNLSGDLCGYVYITPSNSFMYYCIFCEDCFESSTDFQNHNLKEHFEISYLDQKQHVEIKEVAVLPSPTEDLELENKENINQACEQLEILRENAVENIQVTKELYIKIEPNVISDKENELDEANDSNDDSSISNHNVSFEIKTEENFTANYTQIDEATEHSNENSSVVFPFGLNDLDETNLRCRYCKKQFNKKVSLIQHTKSHFKYVLTCNICGKHASTRSKAQDHKKTHSKIKCDLCDARFSTEKALKNHIKRHEMLKCKYCSKVFKKMDVIQNHLRTHTGEKPHKCDVCPAAFALKRNLKTHVITQHTGDEKNFACKFCDRKFKTKQLHNQHTRRVHLKEKPQQCEFCGLNFANMSGLRRHKLKHHTEYNKRPHHCKLCDKKFVELKNLTEHMNMHTGEKPFQCDICLKSFGQQSTLREHKKLHTSKKTHVCKICGKAFAQHSGCANHMKQHHMITNVN